ncbi:MAG: DUF4416 family protein [Deltaproteobacteria bacterium]|nr:DUF4416 family protein [Deltaproteobacteria bacterium]MBW2116827.1 DUF4416 family protein [Deltaproteobacteria bacterium]MBW2342853.1 DUF4416 family protein [Deltaproteobacteria bacterium]
MSNPHGPGPVKLIASLFSPEKGLIDKVISELSNIFGQVDWNSPELFFDRTKYYVREMGWPLHRRFVSFDKLIQADQLVEVKLKTNEVERRYLRDGNRLVNIDPGYISPERLVLATGKNYVHRIYLSKGIYADLTLVYKRKSFVPLEWTYPDYAEPETMGLFNGVRMQYMNQIKEMKRLD